MPYLGRGLDKGNYLKLDDITSGFNGITTTFNLKAGGSAHYPGSGYSILVSLGGIIQEGESAYTINQDEITFASAPAAVDDCFIISLGVPLGVGVPGNGTVGGTQLSKPFTYDDYFYFDSTNDRVGIGSLTPQYDLDIVSTDTSIARIRSSSSTGTQDSLLLQSNSATALRFQPNFQSANKYNWRVGAQTKIDNGFEITPSNNVGITNFDHTVVGITTTKVGVGTITPDTKLHVWGGSAGSVSAGAGSVLTLEQTGDTKLQFLSANTAYQEIRFGDVNDTRPGWVGYAHTDNSLRIGAASNERLHITSAGKVGIGSINPTSLLTVGSKPKTTSALGTVLISPSSGNASIQMRGGSPTLEFDCTGGGNGRVFTDQADLAISNGTLDGAGTELVRITSTGKVGIGTNGPSQILEVEGGSAAKPTFKHSAGWGALRVAGSAGGSGSGVIFANNYNSGTIEEKWSIYLDGSTDALRFTAGPPETTSAEAVRIKSDGKVVIGDTNTTAQLGVYRDSFNLAEFTNTNADATGAEIYLRKDSSSPADNDSLGLINFVGDNDAGEKITYSYIQSKSTDVTDATEDGTLEFNTRGGGTLAERLRITSEGHIIAGGQGSQIAFNNVGNDAFGCVLELDGSHTTDHHGMLSIVGKTDTNSNVVGRIQFVNSQNSSGSSGSNAGSRNLASIEGRIVTTDSNAGDDCGGLLRFVTKADGGGNSEAMRITSDNRLSVGGETSPSHTFHVRGEAENCIRWIRTGSSIGGSLYSDGGGSGIVGGDGNLNNTGIYLVSDTSIDFRVNGSKRLQIGSSGEILTGGATSEPLYPGYVTARKVQAEIKGEIDVGNTRHHGSLAINCTNENASLHLVRSQADNTSGLDAGLIGFTVFDGTDFHQCARIMASRDATGGDNDTPGRLTFHTTADGASSATERLRITSGGDVGINTTNPATKLHLAGDLTITSSDNRAEIHFGEHGAATDTKAMIRMDQDSGTDGALEFWTEESGTIAERLHLNANGRIGLGTDNPGRHCDVFDDSGGNRVMNIRGVSASGAFLAFQDLNTTDDSRVRIGEKGGNKLSLRGDEHHIEKGDGTSRMVIDSSGNVTSKSATFNNHQHYVCQGGAGGASVKNYILIVKTDQDDVRLSGHFCITRHTGTSGTAMSKIEANLISNNSAADWRYQTRSFSTRGSFPGLEGRWVTLTYDSNDYYAIRLDPATDSSRWPSKCDHCYFTGTENGCIGHGFGTIINDNDHTITSITELDDIQGSTVVRNSFNYIKEGHFSVQGGDGQAAAIIQPYELDVNNGSQPIPLTVKSQKNTVLEVNRMYTQGILIQFRQNNDARGYIENSGTTSDIVTSGSDIRLKKNFEDWTEEVLPHFKALKPKKFHFNEESDDDKKTKGYIAQDNLEAFSEAYPVNPNDDRYWFKPGAMVPYLMKALQEEIIKREAIEEKYNALEARISALES